MSSRIFSGIYNKKIKLSSAAFVISALRVKTDEVVPDISMWNNHFRFDEDASDEI